MTERDDSAYAKSYGAWAGDPKGQKPNFDCCCAEVRGPGRFANYHQCQKPRGHGPGLAYCVQHDPATTKARAAARANKERLEHNRARVEWNGPFFLGVLEQIAAGAADPQTLARKAIDAFNEGAMK